MNEETFEIAKEHDLDFDQAEKLQEVMEDAGLDTEDALEIYKEF